MFFNHNPGYDFMRRCKLRLIWWFLDWWKHFLGFLDILEDTRIKLPEFGDHQTEFGGAYMVRTQDLRKSMFFTWIMSKSVCEVFLDGMIPWHIFTSHIQPSPEIWFEREHFENLGFSGPWLKDPPVTSWDWNGCREKNLWIL